MAYSRTYVNVKDNIARCIIFGDVTKPAKKLFIQLETRWVLLLIKLCSYTLLMLANIAHPKRPPCGRPSYGKFPETFPKMFAHRFLLAYFLPVTYISGNFTEIFITSIQT